MVGHEPSVAERYNRLRKAIALADLLDAANITSAEIQLGADDQWKQVAELCEPPVRTPSEETRQEVIRLLVGREAARGRMKR